MKLAVNDLTTGYLRKISFSLDNENLVILGSNGAGKTTLAKAIVNLVENDTVTYDGRKVSQMGAKERAEKLTFVPSRLDVFDEYLTVREYLELCVLSGPSREKVAEVMERVGISALGDASCTGISSGESQLVLFASGLLQDAELTFFDEPTANLDSDRKIAIYDLLRTQRRFTAVITHDLNLAYRLGHRILFLRNGEAVFDGAAGDFFAPSSLASLFGDSVIRVGEHFMVNYR